MTLMQRRGPQTPAMLGGFPRTPRAGQLADAGLVVLIFLVGLPSAIGRPQGNAWLGLLLGAGLAVPLLWRRRFPLPVFLVISAVAFLQWSSDRPLFADVALLVAFYTIAARDSLRRSVLAACVLEVGCLLAAASWAPHGPWLVLFVLLSGMAAAAFFVGTTMRARRAHLAELEDRAQRLELERDQQARLAVAGERARIAREMHDIVAHNLSVMIALADGASLTIREDAERAAVAIGQVSATGRQALSQMRRLLGVLRDDDDDSATAMAPQPGLGDLEHLLAQVRLVGLRGELVTEGQPPAQLAPGLQLTVYRLVQEALTNVLKHAVGATVAVVRLTFRHDRLEVEVTDDGTGSASRSSGGHGITGMRERAAVYGGVVEAGPSARTGWRVRSGFDLTPTVEA